MKRLITSLLVLGTICALLLYINTGSWAILAVVVYMTGGSVYLWIDTRPAPQTEDAPEEIHPIEDPAILSGAVAYRVEAPARAPRAHGGPAPAETVPVGERNGQYGS